jgi:hypothetical protein
MIGYLEPLTMQIPSHSMNKVAMFRIRDREENKKPQEERK